MQFTPVTSKAAIAFRSGTSAATASSLSSVTKMWVAPLSYSSTGSSDPETPSAAKSACVSATGRTSGRGCSMRPKTMRPESSRSSATVTTPAPVSSAIAPSWSGAPRTYAVPRIGCPAKGISWRGLKMRTLACPSASAGRTNVVSENPISSVSACIVSASRPRASVNTAS